MGNNPSIFSSSNQKLQHQYPAYRSLAGEGASDKNPVENVSWNDVKLFAISLPGRKAKRDLCLRGMEYQLPTEAQWEYACRAGTLSPLILFIVTIAMRENLCMDLTLIMNLPMQRNRSGHPYTVSGIL